MAARLHGGIPWAGLVTGPAAWAFNQTAGYAMVGWICAHHLRVAPVLALVCAAIALAGGYMSWRAWLAVEEAPAGPHSGGKPYHLLAAMSAALAVLFAALILIQGGAGLTFHGCER